MTRLTNAAVIVVTPDARVTAAWYRDILGFRVVEHYDAEEAFAAAYRDSVEIVFVQATRGELQPNRIRHGAGFDVYLSPETVEGVDELCAEAASMGAHIVREPAMTPYGSYECVIEDVDGRYVGIGRIRDRQTFFRGTFD
jgi:catechol 2,3-dioxygenase-like lactoylglutathione lyase family enzyme